MASTERYTHEDRVGRLCVPLTTQPDDLGRIAVEYAEHLSQGRRVAPHVEDTLPAMIHPRTRAASSTRPAGDVLIGRVVHFTGNLPDGTPDQFSGVVIDESAEGSEVEVQVYGYDRGCWLPRVVVAEVI